MVLTRYLLTETILNLDKQVSLSTGLVFQIKMTISKNISFNESIKDFLLTPSETLVVLKNLVLSTSNQQNEATRATILSLGSLTPTLHFLGNFPRPASN